MAASEPPYVRFQRMYQVDLETGCWNWIGTLYPNGYGQMKCFGRMRGAHQVSFELHKGPIPDGAHILHSCDNKKCVNPGHLRSGTHQENMRDAVERNRMRKGDNHPFFGVPNPRRGAFLRTATPVLVLGKLYGSQNEAERELGLGSGTVRYWIKRENGKAALVARDEYFSRKSN